MNNKGITLIEVITAMVLLVFIVTSANTFLVNSVKTKSSITSVSEATNLGNNILELVRTKPYTLISDTSFTSDNYHCELSVDEEENMKSVSLQVSWNAKSHSIELNSIIAQ